MWRFHCICFPFCYHPHNSIPFNFSFLFLLSHPFPTHPPSLPTLTTPTHPHYPPSPHPPTLTTHPHYTHPQATYNRGNSVMSVDRLLELLKQFKDSTNKRERVWLARFCTTVDIVLPCHCKQPDVEVAFSLIPLSTSLSSSSFPILSQPTHPHYPPSPHPPTLTTHPHHTHPPSLPTLTTPTPRLPTTEATV